MAASSSTVRDKRKSNVRVGTQASDKKQKGDKHSNGILKPHHAARITKTARNRKKREKIKHKVKQLKAAARLEATRARARGLPPPKPCHLCQKTDHWSQDCEKYGAWKAKMDKIGKVDKTNKKR
ncbi:hypothetical protein F4861DRAFT_536439 [Xylaria intraflava]|nr:hypothetical protein F4861DRAFT_536439 [Xylaria intraflava]